MFFSVFNFMILVMIALVSYGLLGRLSNAWAGVIPWRLPRLLRGLLSLGLALLGMNLQNGVALGILHVGAFSLLLGGVAKLVQLIAHKRLTGWWCFGLVAVLPLVLTLGLLTYGSINMGQVQETRYTVVTHKPIRQQGYRIAFLSDLHYGTIQDPALVQQGVEKINALQPDVVILGGDILDEGTSKAEMLEVFQVLGQLDAPTYYIYGNHDRQLYSGGKIYSQAELTAAIESNGIRILEDSTAMIGEDLLLIGRADPSVGTDFQRKDIRQLVENAPQELFLVTADHQPLEAKENDAAGVDLTLSGHTHAGQIFPGGLLLDLIGNMSYGRYETGNCTSIVSSGFAGWGFPFRTQAHCEYVIVDILPEGIS